MWSIGKCGFSRQISYMINYVSTFFPHQFTLKWQKEIRNMSNIRFYLSDNHSFANKMSHEFIVSMLFWFIGFRKNLTNFSLETSPIRNRYDEMTKIHMWISSLYFIDSIRWDWVFSRVLSTTSQIEKAFFF